MTVMWHTSLKLLRLCYGPTDACKQSIEGNASVIHEVVLKGLEPRPNISIVESRTPRYFLPERACYLQDGEENPYAFAVISIPGNRRFRSKLQSLPGDNARAFFFIPEIWFPQERTGSTGLSIFFQVCVR